MEVIFRSVTQLQNMSAYLEKNFVYENVLNKVLGLER